MIILQNPLALWNLLQELKVFLEELNWTKSPIDNNQVVKISDILINLDTKQAEVNGKSIKSYRNGIFLTLLSCRK